MPSKMDVLKTDAGLWGKIEDPDKVCAFRLGTSILAISVPGNDLDLTIERGKMNAPRVLQPVRGNFTVEMKVPGKFEAGDSKSLPLRAYQGAGFFIRKDDNNYIRLESAILRIGSEPVAYANFEARVGGRVVRFGGATPSTTLDDEEDTWLKIERKGNEFKAYATQERGKW